MTIQEEFEKILERVEQLKEASSDEDKLALSDEDKLILYGLYKQATVGPLTTPRPNRFNALNRYKWDAWKAVEGKSKEEAMQEYIAKVKELHAAATTEAAAATEVVVATEAAATTAAS